MKNKGQALLEFVLILPIFLLILFSIIDFGRLFSERSSLEQSASEIALLVLNEKPYDGLYDDLNITIKSEGDVEVIEVSKNILIISPLVKATLKDKFLLKERRVIVKDE